MQRFATVLALSSLFATPLHAASDPGLMLHDTRGGQRQVGAGARVSVTVPLGAARSEERHPVIAFDAGPAVTRTGGMLKVRDRFRVAPLTRVALRPGYDANWSLAGQRLAEYQAPAALRDEEARLADGERKNVSTLGKVGIGVGVLVLAAGVGLLILIDEANDNSD